MPFKHPEPPSGLDGRSRTRTYEIRYPRDFAAKARVAEKIPGRLPQSLRVVATQKELAGSPLLAGIERPVAAVFDPMTGQGVINVEVAGGQATLLIAQGLGYKAPDDLLGSVLTRRLERLAGEGGIFDIMVPEFFGNDNVRKALSRAKSYLTKEFGLDASDMEAAQFLRAAVAKPKEKVVIPAQKRNQPDEKMTEPPLAESHSGKEGYLTRGQERSEGPAMARAIGSRAVLAGLLAGILGISVVMMFTPWKQTFSERGAAVSDFAVGHSPIFKPPERESIHPEFGMKVDTARLLVYLTLVLLVSGAVGLAWFVREGDDR